MKKNSLNTTGLSLSQAQSISNLCYQRALEIDQTFAVVNNYSKKVVIDNETKTLQSGSKLPDNVLELLQQKSGLHACQAFLMENIKAKDQMLTAAKNEAADVSKVEEPERPVPERPEILSAVNEDYGWAQLKASEINEFLEVEAFAAHIGQFIHKDGLLARLRSELPHVPEIEWLVIKDGVKSPVTIDKHHKSPELLKLHEDLAALHRVKEQRVNYFKAKVKNLITKRNAEIAKLNADAQNECEKNNNENNQAYHVVYSKYNEQCNSIRKEFEKLRQAKISEIAAMRIEVDPRFQETVNEFLTKVPEKED